MRRLTVLLLALVMLLALCTPAYGAILGQVTVRPCTLQVVSCSGFSGPGVALAAPKPGDTRDVVLISWRTAPYPATLKYVNAALWVQQYAGPGMGYAKVLVNPGYTGTVTVYALE